MINFKISVKKNDKEWQRMKKRLLKPTTKSVQVGWFSEARYTNGTPVAWIALLNEYGYYTSGKYQGYHPPRPFFRTFLKAYIENQIFREIDIIPLINQVAQGKITWNTLYKKLGEKLVDWVKHQIITTDKPPNTPLTISLKGFNDPLINTGTMYDTVRYRLSRAKRGR